MEKNAALTILRVLRHAEPKSMSDAELRKATGLNRIEIDLATEELESEGLLIVARTYKLSE
jgi:DNA-binding IclR family transcriptional regulator